MNFTPMSEKECEDAKKGVIEKGEYSVELVDVTEEISKTGKEMFKCKVKIYNGESAVAQIFDYLMPTGQMAYKFRHACVCSGLEAKYNAGTVTAFDLKGKEFNAVIGIQPSKDGYPEKNIVEDYKNKLPF